MTDLARIRDQEPFAARPSRKPGRAGEDLGAAGVAAYGRVAAAAHSLPEATALLAGHK